MSRELDRIRRVYDRSPQRYDRGMALTDRLVARGRAGVGERARGSVLEVGVGTGLSLPHYGPAVASVVGVDLSSGMLGVARARAPACAFPVAFALMDAQRLGFPERCFDSVCFSLCLCTVPDPAAAVREAIRVARPGAPLLFLEHVRSHVWPIALLQDALNPLTVVFQGDHFNRRTASVVAEAGVEVLSVERWGFGIFNLIVGHKPAR